MYSSGESTILARCLAEEVGSSKSTADPKMVLLRAFRPLSALIGQECVHMATQFMDVKQTAEYLNMSVPWVYREAPRLGLVSYKFGRGRNAKIQFKISDVLAWVKQQAVSE